MSKYFGFCVASKKSEKTAEQAKIIKSYKWKKTIPSFSFLTNNPLFFFFATHNLWKIRDYSKSVLLIHCSKSLM